MLRMLKCWFAGIALGVLVVCMSVSVFAAAPIGYAATGWVIHYSPGEDVDGRELYASYNNPPKITLGKASAQVGPGQYSDWQYQMPVTISAGEYDRADWVMEVEVDFDVLLKEAGSNKKLGKDSVRVVEIDENGDVLAETPSQFDVISGSKGELVWLVEGITEAGSARNYVVLFDITSKSKPDYETSLVYESFDRTLENAEYMVNFNEYGILEGQWNLEVWEHQSVIGGDGGWCQWFRGEDNGWWQPSGQMGFLTIVNRGPVRVTINANTILRNPAVEHSKSYTVYYLGKRIKFDVEWIVPDDVTLGGAEGFRSYYLPDHGPWGCVYFDGEQLVKEDIVTDPWEWRPVTVAENWIEVYHREVNHGVVVLYTELFGMPSFGTWPDLVVTSGTPQEKNLVR